MENKTKIILIAVLVAGLLSAPMLVQSQQENEYYAITSSYSNIQNTSQPGVFEISYLVNYVPVTGSATYTLTKSPLTTRINISQPTQINAKIASDIKAFGNSSGYDVKRVLLPSYVLINP